MLLNAALGDQSLFVSADELVEMWRIFTPLLHQIDEQRPEVVIYPFGMVPTGWAEWAQANLAPESVSDHGSGVRPPSPPPRPQPTLPPPPGASATASDMAPAALGFDRSMPFSVIVFGATGDLARKKLFPALYQLVLLGHFPRTLNIVGYGRSKVQLEEFLEKQCVNVKEQPALPKDEFKVRGAAGGGQRRWPPRWSWAAQQAYGLTAQVALSRRHASRSTPALTTRPNHSSCWRRSSRSSRAAARATGFTSSLFRLRSSVQSPP